MSRKKYIKEKTDMRRHSFRFVIGIVFFFTVVMGKYVQMELLASDVFQTFTFTESDDTLINPARGFYTQIYPSQAAHLETVKELGQKLVLVTEDLQDYLDVPLTETELLAIEQVLAEARAQGLMTIFRFAYLWESDGVEPELSVIHTHIRQLSALFNEYEDVVLAVQAGMIGLWGEWHGSAYLEDEESLRTEAVCIVKWWLEELEETIQINLRRPLFLAAAIEEGCDASRLGLHNDALLSTDSDMGTYLDRENELLWCQEHLNGAVSGGEMPSVSAYTELTNACKEFDQLSITYLNAYYNIDVLRAWYEQTIDGENAYTYMEKKLGYRYYVSQLRVNKKLYSFSKQLSVEVTLANSGFSKISNRFHLYLVLDDGVKKQLIRLENQSEEKKIEIYSAKFSLWEEKAFDVGLCYMDADEEFYDELPQNAQTVAFANEQMEYKDGVNYFISYRQKGDHVFAPKLYVKAAKKTQ